MTRRRHEVSDPRMPEVSSPLDWYINSPVLSEPTHLSRQLSNASSYGPLTPGSEASVSAYAFSPTTADDVERENGSYGTAGSISGAGGEGMASSTTSSGGYDEADTQIDWTQYDYVADDDSGFWRLQPQYVPGAGVPEYIRHSNDSGSSRRGGSSSSGGGSQRWSQDMTSETRRWVCLTADCTAGAFKRLADLQRHYAQVHSASTAKETYVCDYSKCARRHEPFGRRDHFRDHLRDFHTEDICKRGSPIDEGWLETRRMADGWWRCSKCLVRVRIDECDFTCPQCKSPCEESRQKARRTRYNLPSPTRSSNRQARR
ncbi:hypothetical protein B0T11DRAFT_20765 [Plectosphaerella cucumerina]|uniref:C2H2-type domain-containing protein n=1 Tax=Plectosphaerella cucumerina TaxID=40658 RepID=A0A8K0TTN7_9PEZI|nr:hypothetical protein B0T11DRAFT_20765 [Plectosphaerella cucumerina]